MGTTCAAGSSAPDMLTVMTWTAPDHAELPDPPLVGDDLAILRGFLAWERSTLVRICAGLTGEQLAARPLPSTGLSLLGLVRHLAKVERIWFRERAAAQPVERLWGGGDTDFDDGVAESAEADLDLFVRECRLADEAVAGLAADDTCEAKGDTFSLRAVYTHMIAEYSRHNGHADLLREAIDGRTGVNG